MFEDDCSHSSDEEEYNEVDSLEGKKITDYKEPSLCELMIKRAWSLLHRVFCLGKFETPIIVKTGIIDKGEVGIQLKRLFDLEGSTISSFLMGFDPSEIRTIYKDIDNIQLLKQRLYVLQQGKSHSFNAREDTGLTTLTQQEKNLEAKLSNDIALLLGKLCRVSASVKTFNANVDLSANTRQVSEEIKVIQKIHRPKLVALSSEEEGEEEQEKNEREEVKRLLLAS